MKLKCWLAAVSKHNLVLLLPAEITAAHLSLRGSYHGDNVTSCPGLVLTCCRRTWHSLREEASEGIVLHKQQLHVDNAEDFWHLNEQNRKRHSGQSFLILQQSPDTIMQMMSNDHSPH